jgi:hypothetical protein
MKSDLFLSPGQWAKDKSCLWFADQIVPPDSEIGGLSLGS